MLDLESGVYFSPAQEHFPGEEKYRFESTYYIRYNAQKALYALKKLFAFSRSAHPDCRLCHIYVDLLFEACGMLYNRFVVKNSYSNGRRSQVENNRREYEFSEVAFPELTKAREIRNFIEHVGEKSDSLIGDNAFHGTFNVVYEGMNAQVHDGLVEPTRPQNNLLNFERMTNSVLWVSGSIRESRTVSLCLLREELQAIEEKADCNWRAIGVAMFCEE